MQILMFIIATTILILLVKLSYKKCKTGIEKVVLILYGITYLTPILIYYLDLWNIPSLLNLTNNINSQNWLSFLSSYTSSIVSTILGVTASIYIAITQIRKNNEDNEKRDLENLRIQNMPILKYSFNSENSGVNELENLIITNIDDGIPYNFNIYLKNVGLNTIKNIKVDFKSDLINHSKERILGKETLEVMEKGEEKEINRFFTLKQSDVPYKIIVIVYYEDVLSNWYKQEIQIEYIATSIFKSGGYIGNIKYEVKEAKIWEKK